MRGVRDRWRRVVGRRAERGAAAVEFALVMPILFMLLMGVVTTGLMFFDHSSATNAVREAARYGAAADATTPATWATSVRTRLKDTYFDTIGPVTNAQICVDLVQASGTVVSGSYLNGGSCGTAPSLPAGMASGSCAVRVWVRKPETIDLIVAPTLHLNIGASSVAYYGRTVKSTASPYAAICEAS